MDGTAPTILAGYGAYGITENPVFSPNVLAWVERRGARVKSAFAWLWEAKRPDVLRLILGESLTLAIPGLLIGSLLAFGLTRAVSSSLVRVSPSSPSIYAAAALFTLLIASLCVGRSSFAGSQGRSDGSAAM